MLKPKKNKPGVWGSGVQSKSPEEPRPEPSTEQKTVNSISQINYKGFSSSKSRKKDSICYCPTCKDSRYEIFNKVSENGDSIYIPSFEELKGGKIFVNLDAISDTEREELWKRLGPATKNNYEDDY